MNMDSFRAPQTKKLNRLGVPSRINDDWTPAEEEAMRKSYKTYGAKEMSRRLKRSEGSVKGKASRMGLGRKWVLIEKDPEA